MLDKSCVPDENNPQTWRSCTSCGEQRHPSRYLAGRLGPGTARRCANCVARWAATRRSRPKPDRDGCRFCIQCRAYLPLDEFRARVRCIECAAFGKWVMFTHGGFRERLPLECLCGTPKPQLIEACARCLEADDPFVAAVRAAGRPLSSDELAQAVGCTKRAVLRSAGRYLKRVKLSMQITQAATVKRIDGVRRRVLMTNLIIVGGWRLKSQADVEDPLDEHTFLRQLKTAMRRRGFLESQSTNSWAH